MITEETIKKAVSRLVAAANPIKVILFGSYARGEATEDSDLDLLVIEPDVKDKGEEMVRLRRAVGRVGIGVEVLVYSETDVLERGEWCTTPLYWALREGRVLYDASK